ncbi:MAG: FliO/MopB family protein [Phycisphaerales bacterium]
MTSFSAASGKTIRRIRVCLLTATIAVTCATSVITLASQDSGASQDARDLSTNGPMRLVDRDADPPTVLGLHEPASENEEASAAAIEAQPAGPTAPTRESQPLGAPAGLFDLGAADERLDRAAGDGQSSGRIFGLQLNDLARTGSALAIVIGILLLLAVIMRRMRPGAGAGRPAEVLQFLARYPVARGQQLLLLKIDRRILLIHQSRQGMTTLSEIDDPHEVASLLSRIESGSRPSFASSLRRALSTERSDVIDTVDLTRRAPDSSSRILPMQRVPA